MSPAAAARSHRSLARRFPSIRHAWHARGAANTRLDLHAAIPAFLALLREIDRYPTLYTDHRTLRRAIRRYETCWIPLRLAYPHRCLAPPLDVQWIWLCHMLSPVDYARDVTRIRAVYSLPGAEMLDHRILTDSQRHPAMAAARDVWNARFPNERFEFVHHRGGDLDDPMHFESVIEYDLITAAGRQMAFYYQICLPQYSDRRFIDAAVQRYLKGFLYLKRLYPREVIVPTYDIDLVWHCHMLHPTLYAEETKQMTKFLLPHDDSLNDRSIDSNLINAWKTTCQLWRKHISRHGPAVSGAMFRGNITSAERALRPAIQTSISKLIATFDADSSREITGKVVKITPDNFRHASSPDIPWLHLADPARIDDSALKIDRYTQFIIEPHGTSALQSVVRHRVLSPCGAREICRKIFSSIEIHATHPEAGDKLPLATAHTMDDSQLITDANQLESTADARNVLQKDELAYLLRIAGEDAAIIIGSWRSFAAPIPGRPGVEGGRFGRPGVRGREGHLELRLGVFKYVTECGYKVEWQTIQMMNQKNPSVFKFCDSISPLSSSDTSVTVDFAQGRISCPHASSILVGYLVAITAASAYVSLQPRFKPGGDLQREEVTWYPAWATAQRGFAMLEGAGGECRGKDSESWGDLADACFGDESFVGAAKDFRPRQRFAADTRSPYFKGRRVYVTCSVPGGCGGCGGCGGGGGFANYAEGC